MRFTEAEINYLTSQRLGRLATAQRKGTLQNSPVGFRYNPELDTIDIRGRGMVTSQKYRNVAAGGPVAFVVDDIVPGHPPQIRCVEIRGTGEAVPPPDGVDATGGRGIDGAIIRIHPTRIISFGLGDSDDPFTQGANKRDV
jgi:pyridoxamine 5'-phosphate oxidase family protein